MSDYFSNQDLRSLLSFEDEDCLDLFGNGASDQLNQWAYEARTENPDNATVDAITTELLSPFNRRTAPTAASCLNPKVYRFL
ncbi:hypothetical protein NpPPO83_00009951 [Neofusicoccum parvum]|uniref:Uncharacterized protein n=1 Tax=Neofusicoccum parvum TaxID=310453 RepID=A0ACB5S1J2_9PEZI|nr:hypothetical protein NpPPO83_00009951 [Neofusicoccum parvum]